MISEEARAHEQRLRERRENPPEPPEGMDPVAAARLANDMFGSWATDPGVERREVSAGGTRAIWVDVAGSRPDRVLLYFHGGGYMIGSADHVVPMLGHIAGAGGCRALSVDYRLAPEHPFPAAVDDAVAAYRWLLDEGIQAASIVIAGDSAGGGIALAAQLALRENGQPLPGGSLPISPWADLRCAAPSWTTNAGSDMILSKQRLSDLAELYLQGSDATEPLASPLLGDFRGLPPMYVQAAGGETLLDDCLAVTALAARAGLEARLDVFAGMQHVFQYCAGNMPEADDAVARTGAWLQARWGGR